MTIYEKFTSNHGQREVLQLVCDIFGKVCMCVCMYMCSLKAPIQGPGFHTACNNVVKPNFKFLGVNIAQTVITPSSLQVHWQFFSIVTIGNQ